MLWQASYLPQGGELLEGTLLFEAIVLVVGTWFVWKCGGFEEALTQVVERTRIFFPWGNDSPPANQTPQATKFCRYCGARIPRYAVTCEDCHARLLR